MGGDRQRKTPWRTQKKLPLLHTLPSAWMVAMRDFRSARKREATNKKRKEGYQKKKKKFPVTSPKQRHVRQWWMMAALATPKSSGRKKKLYFILLLKKRRTETQSATFCVLRAPSLQSRWCSGIGSACNTEASRRGGMMSRRETTTTTAAREMFGMIPFKLRLHLIIASERGKLVNFLGNVLNPLCLHLLEEFPSELF